MQQHAKAALGSSLITPSMDNRLNPAHLQRAAPALRPGVQEGRGALAVHNAMMAGAQRQGLMVCCWLKGRAGLQSMHQTARRFDHDAVQCTREQQITGGMIGARKLST